MKGRPNAPLQSVWNRIEAVAASRPMPAPSITHRIGAMSPNSTTGPAGRWKGGSVSSSSASVPSVARQMQPPASTSSLEDFPSLPSGKPKERIGLHAGAIPLWQAPSWGATNKETTSSIVAPQENTKTKGKKKGKTVLFHVG